MNSQISAKYWGIILAAGKGSRMEATVSKQYLKIHKKTLLKYAIQPFLEHPLIEKVVVLLAEEDKEGRKLILSHPEKIIFAPGGKERVDSFRNGLIALKAWAKEEDWIIDHDVARPCLDKEDLEKLMGELKNHSVGGLLAYPVVDTLKKSNDHQEVEATVDRKDLWHAVTPQMFRYGVLKKVFDKTILQKKITDTASAVESVGYKPKLICGKRHNIKVTYPEDLTYAKFFLKEKNKV